VYDNKVGLVLRELDLLSLC